MPRVHVGLRDHCRCRVSTRPSPGCAPPRQTGLVTYVTAGDPDRERSGEILQALDRAGADVLEVGVPFSDPLADGPVIQRASERALAAGATLSWTLDLIAQHPEIADGPGGGVHLREPGVADRPRRLRGTGGEGRCGWCPSLGLAARGSRGSA